MEEKQCSSKETLTYLTDLSNIQNGIFTTFFTANQLVISKDKELFELTDYRVIF